MNTSEPDTDNNTLTAQSELPADNDSQGNLPFPVIAIGASAGGVEALTAFFNAMVTDSGAAFVVIQHSLPDHDSLLADILSRQTQMPVMPIDSGVAVKPNHVYVARPARTVTLVGGKLLLGEPVEKRGHRRPIDDFLRSLSVEQYDRSIAIILSGNGSNGTAGAQAIKAVGGLCIAQDPTEAAYSGMPTSLIHAGYADQVLKVEKIAEVIASYVHQPYLDSDPERHANAQRVLLSDQNHLNEIRAILRTRSGHDFNGYKKPTIVRRIQRRMGLRNIIDLGTYAVLLRQEAEEVSLLANDLMINVTGFFRDPEAWEVLRVEAIRPLIESRDSGQTIRAWVSACASGEEAYSLAILIAEEAERAQKFFDVRIFATDVADKALTTARSGIYPGGIEGNVSPERLERFFEKDENTYRIKKVIRDSIIFSSQNALRDPPFSRVDIACCRNLLIYLEPRTQQQLLAMLSFAVREGGLLFLGSAESLGMLESRFEAISKSYRIYRRIDSLNHLLPDFRFTTVVPHNDHEPETSQEELKHKAMASRSIQQALLDRYAHPTVVIDRREQAVYFHGDLQPYLIYPSGEPTRYLYDIVRIELSSPLRRMLRELGENKNHPVVTETVIQVLGGYMRVDLRLMPLVNGSKIDYFLISFEALPDVVNHDSRADTRISPEGAVTRLQPKLSQINPSEAEDEIRFLRTELQNSVEAFEASNEELKSANEEMTSINEELQSANEELESSQEELQALNEELSTVNNQLQIKVVEIEAANSDLANLLSSTNIAVIFLDTQLNVRRFTPAMADLLELIPSDTGRPIRHLAMKTKYDILDQAQAIFERRTAEEKEIQSYSGRWYLQRTLPYLNHDRHLDGIVITFVDISARKQAESALSIAHERLQGVIEQMPAAVLIAEAPSGQLLYGNHEAAMLFGREFPKPLSDAHWTIENLGLKGFHDDGRLYDATEWPLARSLMRGETVVDEEISFKHADESWGYISVSSAPVRNSKDEIVTAVATFGDITARKHIELELQQSEERFRVLVNSSADYAIFMMDTNGRIISWNRAAEQMTGWLSEDIRDQSAAVLHTPEDRATQLFENLMKTALSQGKANAEHWIVRRDGSRFWASGILSAVYDEQSQLSCFVKILHDRSEGKQFEERLRQANVEAEHSRNIAEAANRTKDEFVAMVSHELRSPLNVISLSARLLDSGKATEKNAREGIKMIAQAAHSQQQLIDDLLDISSMAAGKLRLTFHVTRLRDTFDAAIKAVQPAALSHGVQLDYEVYDNIGAVCIDPGRLQQVMVNLLNNAIKFTPTGGQVRISMRREGDNVEIRVVDTGIGIRQEFLSTIFDRFTQAESGTARRYSGLGLGLAIAKQIVESHGGSIIAASDGEGLGSTFIVVLPLPVASEDIAGNGHDTGTVAANLNNIDVLLIDDEAPNRDVAQRLLQGHGAVVRAVESAAAAREAILVKRPDVILSDIGLPGEDGYAFIHALRSTEAASQASPIPAIALTAFVRVEDRNRAIEAGFNAHLGKPLDPEQLIFTLQTLLRTQSDSD